MEKRRSRIYRYREKIERRWQEEALRKPVTRTSALSCFTTVGLYFVLPIWHPTTFSERRSDSGASWCDCVREHWSGHGSNCGRTASSVKLTGWGRSVCGKPRNSFVLYWRFACCEPLN